MIVRYRLIEKKYEDGSGDHWLPWGTLYENCSGAFVNHQVLFKVIPDEYKGVTHYFSSRIEELGIGLEDGERMFGEHAHRFRLRPETLTVEGQSHREIRQRLWERIFQDKKVSVLRKE